jgi:hypothetical protein
MVERQLFVMRADCDKRTGVYEPLVAVEPDATRTTPLAREPVSKDGPATVMHPACAAAVGDTPPP